MAVGVLLMVTVVANCGGSINLGGTGSDGGSSGDSQMGSSQSAGSTSASSSGSAPTEGISGSAGSASSAVSSGSSGSSGSSQSAGSTDAVGDCTDASSGAQTCVTLAVALEVAGVAQTPMNCPSDDWEYPQTECAPLDAGYSQPLCPGHGRVTLANTGNRPIAYIAALNWNGTGYVPGVLTGEPDQLAGVLQAGEEVDITSVYKGTGVVAVVGGAGNFSLGEHYVSDEGTIPWPAGVLGLSDGTMTVAELELRSSCGVANVIW
jgi:hypothetical protein